MSEEPFALETQEIKITLRAEMKQLVRQVALTIEKGATDQEVRRRFRRCRPEITYRSAWVYRVYREEVRKLMGLAVGPMSKRTVKTGDQMKCTHEWLRKKGFKIIAATPFEGSPGA